MSQNFGSVNPELTRAIQKLSKGSTLCVRFIPHAEDEMDNDGFDHDEVLTCLRKGKAFGPENHGRKLRANVVHRGLHIRVVVEGLDEVNEDWSMLQRITVVTVMRVT